MQCTLAFDTWGEMQECVQWCRKRAIVFGCSYLDGVEDNVVDTDNRDIAAHGVIFNCDMSRTDFLKFKMRWASTILEQK